MHRTYSPLRLFIAATALLLAVLAAPAAQAQSVTGSGQYHIYIFEDADYHFKVNAYTRNNGTPAGSIRLEGNGIHFNSDTGGFVSFSFKETYSVESLSVTGNTATVLARAKSDRTLYQFSFTDNGDGSVEPDRFNGWLLTSGDITVIP